MARRKANEFHEEPDAAQVEAEVTDEGYDPGPPDETLNVNLDQPAPPVTPEPKVSDTTKAEMEEGRRALAEKAKSKQAETGDEPV